MDADGSDQAPITDAQRRSSDSPAFSPDGKKIVFAGMPGRDVTATELYTINVDGSGEAQLTRNQVSESSPSFSPDGTKIVFAGLEPHNGTIYSVAADGSGQTRLTGGSVDLQPTWGVRSAGL